MAKCNLGFVKIKPMLVSSCQGIMRFEVTYSYGVSQFARVVRFCSVRCLFQAAFQSVVQLFPYSLPSLIGGLGKYRVGKYLH